MQTPTRILLVEDDDGIATPLRAALAASGHEVRRVATGRAAIDAAWGVDAVVLDLGLPDLDGVEVCRRLREEQGPDLPILVLTARTSETDVVVGLDGAHRHRAANRAAVVASAPRFPASVSKITRTVVPSTLIAGWPPVPRSFSLNSRFTGSPASTAVNSTCT